MKKINFTTVLCTTIATFFLMTGLAVADDWQPNGNDIYYDSGNVGIGTSSPDMPLHISTTGNMLKMERTGASPGGFTAKVSQGGGIGTGSLIWDALVSTSEFVIRDSSANTKFIVDTSTGNVGIGTTSPGAKLEVTGGNLSVNRVADSQQATIVLRGGTGQSSRVLLQADDDSGKGFNLVSTNDDKFQIQQQSGAARVTVQDNGNVGIGTTDLDYAGEWETGLYISAYSKGGDAGLVLTSGTDRITGIQFGKHTSNPNYKMGAIYYYNDDNSMRFRTSDGERMRIFNNGNVGIGTTTPSNKLEVCGKIRAKEVIVETGWCDYVFEEDYNLPPLNEVESFIKENKHLPDISSAKEVEEKGLAVSDMLAKQMQKIEELTLYLIEMKKENEALKAELKKTNEDMSKRLAALEEGK